VQSEHGNAFGRFSFVPAKNIFNSDFYAIRGFSNFVMLCTPVLSEADDKLSFN